MKKLIVILSMVLLFLCSCAAPQAPQYDIQFRNDSSYTVTVTDPYGDFTQFSITAGETKTVKSAHETCYSINIESPATEKIIDYKLLSSNSIVIYEYDYRVQYTVTGTASHVDITLNNSDGGTEQYSNVSVPCTYNFKNFSDDFLYISAQEVDGNNSSVTVNIFKKGALFKTSTSSGAYTIATASGSF